MNASAADDASRNLHDVPCVGCSLICDDLDIKVTSAGVEATGNACERARAYYRAVSDSADNADDAARIGDSTATLEQALDRAGEILRAAKLPLLAGLDSDVAGVRAALRLGEQCGAVVDSLHGDALFQNIRVMQTEGWLATTFGEARNRADLLLIFGMRPLTAFPRLVERLTMPAETLFGGSRRRRIYIAGHYQTPLPKDLDGGASTLLSVPDRNLGELAAALQARLTAAQPPAHWPADLDPTLLEELVARLREAEYPVLVWAAAEFDVPHGDLTIQRFAGLARALSTHSRCTTLALSHGSSAITAQQVGGWYCGFPLRVSFNRGAPVYDPHSYRAERMLARGEPDALLWIASIEPAPPPSTNAVPRIVLSPERPSLRADDVFVRVGVPGIDHAGELFRSDGVALSLRKLRNVPWPSAAEVLDTIRERCL